MTTECGQKFQDQCRRKDCPRGAGKWQNKCKWLLESQGVKRNIFCSIENFLRLFIVSHLLFLDFPASNHLFFLDEGCILLFSLAITPVMSNSSGRDSVFRS